MKDFFTDVIQTTSNVLVELVCIILTILCTIVSIVWRLLYTIHPSDKLNFLEDWMFHLDHIERYIDMSYNDTQTKVSIEDYKLYLQNYEIT